MTVHRAEAVLNDLDALRVYAGSGDPAAFGDVVRRYESMVLATCRRALRNESDADDATQETFLKLARHAGEIRSNVGAWLHSCALRSSMDLLRRRSATSRAEVGAACDAAASDDDDGSRLAAWREVEAELDAALELLCEDDRELIIARFFLGRPQGELATQAGVSDGTMSRRIDRALGRLRGRLTAAGVSASSLAALGVMIGSFGGVGMAGSGSASLVKIGLAGVGVSGRVARVSATKSVAIAATLAAVVGGGVLIAAVGLNGAAAGGGGAATALRVAGSTAAPSKKTPELAITSMLIDGASDSSLTVSERGMRVDVRGAGGVSGGGHFMRFAVRPVSERDGVIQVEGELVEVNLPEGVSAPPVGTAVSVTFEPVAHGLEMRLRAMVGNVEHNVRHAWTRPLTEQANGGDGWRSMAGVWHALPLWTARLDKEAFEITREDGMKDRFRILDWIDSGEHARVQTICVESQDPMYVGRRVRMLFRRDADVGKDAWSVAHHVGEPDVLNTWPTGFDESEGGMLMTQSWRRAKR